MSRPRVPEPAYGAQPPPSVDSRDSHGASSPHDNAQRLYYDDEDVEQPHPGTHQYDRRQQYPYPTDQNQHSYNHREQPYDPYGGRLVYLATVAFFH
jgi:hypothetical protein